MLIEAVTILEFDDRVHISSLGFSAPNTLCGITDAGQSESSDEEPNCGDCKEVYKSIKNHKPVFKFKR